MMGLMAIKFQNNFISYELRRRQPAASMMGLVISKFQNNYNSYELHKRQTAASTMGLMTIKYKEQLIVQTLSNAFKLHPRWA